jgi:hypothetical protein
MTTVTETKAEYVFSIVEEFWPVPEELVRPNPSEAVTAAREVESVLFDRMDLHGLQRGQGLCLLICAAKSGKVHPVALLGKELPAVITKNAWDPIGILFGIMVVEKNAIMLQVRPFAKSERVDPRLLEIQTQIALDLKHGKRITRMS